MRILYIGNENLQNEAIIGIIDSIEDYEVNHILPVKVNQQALEPKPHKYSIALVDLISFPYSPDVSIKLIRSNQIADRIIAIHNYKGKKLIQRMIDAGADFYFSVDSGANKLLKIISNLSRPSV